MHALARRARRSLVRQQDTSDCGAACLATVVRYFGGEESLERIRELSGTGPGGTTLLGLHHASTSLNIISNAYRGDLGTLKNLNDIAVLHVAGRSSRRHFVVFYGFADRAFLVGDPAQGVVRMSARELSALWVSRALMTVRPAAEFATTSLPEGAVRRRWIADMVKADRTPLVIALVLGIAVSALSLVMAIFSKLLLDDILPNRDNVKLVVGLGMVMVFMLVQQGLGFVRRIVLLAQAKAFNNRLLGHFLERLIHLPFGFFGSRSTGELVARLNDTQRLQRFVTYVFGGVVINMLVFLTAFIFVTSHDGRLGLWILAGVAALVVHAGRRHGSILRGQRSVMSAHGQNESCYIEALQGIETIKALNAQSPFISLMRGTYARLQQAVYDLGRVGAAFGLWSEVIGIFIVVGVLAGSSALVLRDAMEVGSLIAILQMTTMLVPSVLGFILANVELQEAIVAFERMYAFSSLDPEFPLDPAQASDACSTRHTAEVTVSGACEVNAGLPANEKGSRGGCLGEVHAGYQWKIVEVRGLAFGYPGRRLLLENVGMELTGHEIVALIGGTGTGKSTFLRVLQRLLHPSAGTILVDGTDWRSISTPEWRGALGVVPQSVHLFRGTVLENICPDRTHKSSEVESFCREWGFDQLLAGLPDGYRTWLGEDGVKISGGQRRVVALARALFRRPKVLLLDEATVGLDDRSSRFVLRLLKACRGRMAILLVTYRQDHAAIADRLYLLDGGHVERAPPTAARRRGTCFPVASRSAAVRAFRRRRRPR